MSLPSSRTLIALALAAVSSAPVFAADTELGAIVITATRQATRSNELLSDVSVISHEEIERAGQTTLEQLLARQPGVEIVTNGGPGTNSSVFIRGANSKHTLLLVDGVRVGSATTGDATFSRLPLSQIERIEILRGPASSLYGADAIGGVIQVFTRRGEGEARVNASAGYGSYATQDVNAGVSGSTGALSYSLQAGHFETGGFNAVRNPAKTSFNTDSDGYRNDSASASLAWTPVAGHEFGTNLLFSNGLSRFDSTPNRNRDFRNDRYLGSYSLYARDRLAPAWTSLLRFGHSIDDLTSLAGGIPSSVFRTEQDQLSWQNDLKLPLGNALIAAEYLRQGVEGSSVLPVKERNIRSLLAGWNGSLGDHRLQANLRRDENSQFGNKTTGFAGYGYQFTSTWRGHLSYGTAFRAPTFNELYSPDDPTNNFRGNPDLQPETARNREIGIDWEGSGNQRFSVVHFDNRVRNLITTTGRPVQNLNRATLSGTTLAYDTSFGEWTGGAVVDLQNPHDDATGKRLNRRAREQLKLHVSRNAGPWQFGGEWQLVGDRFDDTANNVRLGGYGLVDLFADYRIDRSWTIFARASNVFDKTYELARDFATPGSSVFVGLRYAAN